MHILGKHQYGKERRETFKLCSRQHDILCRSDYAELTLSIFASQIKLEYYCEDKSVSIE